MTKSVERPYLLEMKNEDLVFRTQRFGAGRGSVLHSGIFNREFSAMLASTAAAGILLLALSLAGKRAVLHYLLVAAVLIGSFPLFRSFVFRERFLEATFSGRSGMTEIVVSGIVRRRVASLPRGSLRDLVVETERTKSGDADAVAFVERIAAQHGTVIPGFGKEQVRYRLMLTPMEGEGFLILADPSMEDVISAYEGIRSYLEDRDMIKPRA